MLQLVTPPAPLMLAQLDPAVMDTLRGAWSLLLVVLGFSVVVFVHELGHFLAAKWAGVRVDKFCIGFGKELFGLTRGETRYGFNILPLGGYVKMLGQEDFAVDKSGELKVKAEEGSFTSKSVGQRMVIVSAGVVMNLIFAAVGLTVYMMVGYRTPPAIIGSIAPATPAARSGLMPGDEVLSVNGDRIMDFEEFQRRIILSDTGEVLELEVLRDGKRVEPPPRILPEFKPGENVRQLGVTPGWTRTVMAVFSSSSDEFAPDELQRNDRFVAVLSDGERHPVRDHSQVWTALTAARGRWVDLLVSRPTAAVSFEEVVRPGAPEIPGTEQRIRARALWYVHPESSGRLGTASLLGLVPRLRASSPPQARSPADLAGLELFDVVVSFAGIDAPTQDELFKLVEDNRDQDTSIVVRRGRAPNAGLSGLGVAFVVSRREAWLEAAAADIAAARALAAAEIDASTLSNADRTQIRMRLLSRNSPRDWLEWLEAVDRHRLTIRPNRPFTLTGSGKTRIGLPVDQPEDDALVVAAVLDEVNGRASPAVRAGIPQGAVILGVDGTAVTTWAELSEALRGRAGATAKLRYRVGLNYRETEMPVPNDIGCALNLPSDARIQSIAGREKIDVEGDGGRKRTLYLPDWQAVRALLKESIGQFVAVRWSDARGEAHDDQFAVTEDNVDPWSLRIGFIPSFMCYPRFIDVRESNPLMAMWQGIRKTHYATLATIQSIRHIAFTRQVGVDKVSGPVGIARIGMQVAEVGWIRLLWFMCLISANLAVINFLPLPIVDGGLFFFLLLEKIRGEPVSIKTQAATQVIGIVLIASVFLFVTFQDILNWHK